MSCVKEFSKILCCKSALVRLLKICNRVKDHEIFPLTTLLCCHLLLEALEISQNCITKQHMHVVWHHHSWCCCYLCHSFCFWQIKQSNCGKSVNETRDQRAIISKKKMDATKTPTLSHHCGSVLDSSTTWGVFQEMGLLSQTRVFKIVHTFILHLTEWESGAAQFSSIAS